MEMKKGFFFTMDAMLAASIIFISILLISSYYIYEPIAISISYQSQDIVRILSEMTVGEINNNYIKGEISSGNITRLNNTILEQIGEFWAEGESVLAMNLANNVTAQLIPEKFGYGFWINGEEIYLKNKSGKGSLVTSRSMISGIAKDKPRFGFSSRAFLKSIASKTTSSYIYFGGFEGQGNITKYAYDIPSDANITSIFMELNAGDNFSLYINDIKCGGTFNSTAGNMTADYWDISYCNESISAGIPNKFFLEFAHGINTAYIGGGYIKIRYKTTQWLNDVETNSTKYWFPGINGIINLYSSFYAPGTINSMGIHLHFYANDTSYLTIGGKVIHRWDGSQYDQEYNISNDDLGTAGYFDLSDDYSLFSNNTVPIRFASYESTTTIVTGGNADVVLVTDLSGSMKKAVDSWDIGNSAPTCSTYNTTSDTRRTRAAVCLDLQMADTVMNFTGNRIWPIFIKENSIINYTWDPASKSDVKTTINNYYNDQGKDKTCLACAINLAYDILNASYNSTRKRFIILMTDGVPTHCAFRSCKSNSSVYGAQQCAGLCDTSGSCDAGDIPGQCTDCTTNNGAVNNTLYSAQRAKNDLNATIYTIGFGPIDDCSLANSTLKQVAQIGNGTYQHSKNVTQLQEIYQNISSEILEQMTQYSQSVTITSGSNFTPSKMYNDSYIEINYTSSAVNTDYGKISIKFQTGPFNSCSPSEYISPDVEVIDAKITSYSGSHWTDGLSVNSYEDFNLSDFGTDYYLLGDPYLVQANHISSGINNIVIRTGDGPANYTGCSKNNSLIFTGLVKSYIDYALPLANASGCNWTIELELGDFRNLKAPSGFDGASNCRFTNTSLEYNPNDAYDTAVYSILDMLDFDKDRRLDIDFDENDLTLDYITLSDVPSLWGPSIIEVRVWE